MTKPEARSVYLKKRMALSANEIETASKIFFDLLCSSFELTAIRVIHTYLPLALKNEPNTWLIINGLRSRFPSIKISIPKMEGNRLINYYFENRAQLSVNAWGIEEPTSGELTPTEKIDVVFVPLLAFDKTGNRVGYGKGYYDRFLKECRSGCKKIGFSFFEPVDEISDADTHDIKLTHSITPKKIYTF